MKLKTILVKTCVKQPVSKKTHTHNLHTHPKEC